MWRRINGVVHLHSVLSSFIISALFVFAILIAAMLTGVLQVPAATESVVFFNIGRIALALTVILLMWKLQVFNADDFKLKGLGKGILLGWVLPVGMLITFILRFPENAAVTSDIYLIFVVILDSFLGTGLFEDIRYKGWFRKPYFISRQRLIRSGLEQFCGKEDFMSGQSIYRDCAA